MKKINILLISFILAFTSSCSLDMSPVDYYGAGNFWNNEAQVSCYMNGLHSDFRGAYSTLQILGEFRGGTFRSGASSLGTSLDDEYVKLNQIDQNKTGVSNWAGFYSRLLQVNHFIEQVENECKFLSDANRKYYLGQAYGIRAYYYFVLYKTYGGVPLVTSVEVLNGKISADRFYVERAGEEATLQLIKEDINKSETNFGDNVTIKSKNVWSKYATLMLKAEVYLWSAKVKVGDHNLGGTADLNVAKTALQGVIGKFSLLPSFANVFSTKNNAEVIFTLYFKDTEATNWGGAFLYADNLFVNQKYDKDGNLLGDALNLKGSGGPLRHEYKEGLWRSYDAQDSRRDATFLDHYTKEAGGSFSFGSVLKKCVGSINSAGNRVYDTDVIIYRYSDALLMMAEVENGLGNSCASYINDVRRRAYGANYVAATHGYTNGSYADNEMAILKERDKEFVWEAKRWYDVVRLHDASKKPLVFSVNANYANTGTGAATVPVLTTDEAYKIVWPLDLGVLNVNPKLKQNTGYDK